MDSSSGGPDTKETPSTTKLGGQARCVLDNFLDKWDHINADNPNYEDVVIRETSIDVRALKEIERL